MLVTLAAFALASGPLRVYFVGNSVTDTLDYGAFSRLMEARGRKLVWGRHVIPGTPLFLPWKGAEEGRMDGFTEAPYGNAVQALSGYDWDAITLQPFDRHEKDIDANGYDEGDLASALRYIGAAAKRNPKVSVFVYARWPRMSVGGKGVEFDKKAYLDENRGKDALPSGLDAWETLWNRPYTGGWDGTNETRAYFEGLVAQLKKVSPARVTMIPVGHAMADLDRRMREGKVPGYRTVWQLYNDGIHLDRTGSYLVGCAFYAALTGDDPRRLPTAPYGIPDDALARAVRESVAATRLRS